MEPLPVSQLTNYDYSQWNDCIVWQIDISSLNCTLTPLGVYSLYVSTCTLDDINNGNQCGSTSWLVGQSVAVSWYRCHLACITPLQWYVIIIGGNVVSLYTVLLHWYWLICCNISRYTDAICWLWSQFWYICASILCVYWYLIQHSNQPIFLIYSKVTWFYQHRSPMHGI